MTDFIIGLAKIILVNLILSGDNAVVIALACRNLHPSLQNKAIFWGSFGAIGLRVILTFVAVWLLQIPFVELLGSLLLIWIAVKLLAGEEENDDINGGSNLREAIKTIIVADLVMSLDNVVAVAGAADGNILLILIGLAISIPLIIWGSQLLMKLMQRFPIIVTIGAALLGYTSGEMIMGDDIVGTQLESVWAGFEHLLPIVLAVVVVVLGKWIEAHKEKQKNAPIVREIHGDL
ncbi:TerC family protein [Brevibacillus ginsengisoli]|uniref:TerC family protein n=1 Tax=Brevibacillus ginsengisoli TaxID=363854 RepID=UPI003CEB4C0D